MTETPRTGARAPWITAAALGGVAVVLAAVLLFVIHPQRDDNGSSAKDVGLSASEQQAMDAASKQVLNILTYSRKTFDSDYARTLAGATGALRADLAKQKASLSAQMTKGKFDLQGAVTSSAFEEVSDKSSLILISAQGYKVPVGGQRTLASTARFQVTMTSVGGKWLASDLQSVGLI
jgi:Mce-associated membrane protein